MKLGRDIEIGKGLAKEELAVDEILILPPPNENMVLSTSLYRFLW